MLSLRKLGRNCLREIGRQLRRPLRCRRHLAGHATEVGTVLGMHGTERARHAFNGRHLSAFEVRQAGETRAPTLHAVKPFGPSIDHWIATPFALILWRQAEAALFKIEHNANSNQATALGQYLRRPYAKRHQA
jgi:hypothetical protein